MDEENNNWKALESNPEVMTEYAQKIGFDTSNHVFQDLFSLEDWAQDMITKPCFGLIMVFPITENQEKHRKEEREQLEAANTEVSKDVFYMKQFAKNACGTVALYHVLGNLPQEYKGLIAEGSVLDNFYKETKDQTPKERGDYFKNSKEVQESHVEAVEEGETEVEETVDHHFVAFVNVNGDLYELDGRKYNAIKHGETSNDSFLSDACKEAQKFMNRDPENTGFGLIVLAGKQAE